MQGQIVMNRKQSVNIFKLVYKKDKWKVPYNVTITQVSDE